MDTTTIEIELGMTGEEMEEMMAAMAGMTPRERARYLAEAVLLLTDEGREAEGTIG